MKTLLGILLLISTQVTLAGDKGHGGDPYEVYAVDFPDQETISNAIEIVETKIADSNLDQDFATEIIQEMHSLQRENKYRYLGNIIVLPGGDDPLGYEIPQEEGHFLGLGAVTRNEKGAGIYFTARALDHGQEDFSRLLFHEVLHHVLPPLLSKDEVAVNELVNSIFIGEIQPTLKRAISSGYYLRPGKVYLSHFLMSWYMRENPSEKIHSVCPTVIKNHIRRKGIFAPVDAGSCFTLLARTLNLPHNLWETKYTTIVYEMRSGYPMAFVMKDINVAMTGVINNWTKDAVLDSARESGYYHEQKFDFSNYCKHTISFFGSCKPGEQILIKDLFVQK